MNRLLLRQSGVEVTMPTRRNTSFRTFSMMLVLGPLALAACDVRAPVGEKLAVRAIAPANGAGVPLVRPGGVARPSLRWSPVPDATRFELEIDGTCVSAQKCAFESPVVHEQALVDTTYVPAGLAAGAVPPIPRRYVWRVRACAGDTCGDWSAARVLVVGMSAGWLNTDINGDGYEDAVVSAPANNAGGMQAGSVSVYLGGPTVPSAPAIVIRHDRQLERFGQSVAMVGDVNADGFGDFLVRTQGDESTPGVAPNAHAYIYLGGVTLHSEPDVVLDCGSVDDESSATAGIGDVNGDGFDDVAIGGFTVDAEHHAQEPSRVEVHFGGPAMANAADVTLSTAPGARFGTAVAAVGDVNGDGYVDFAVGAAMTGGDGAAYVYFGGPTLMATPGVTLNAPAGVTLFGYAVAGSGDFNGDGFADLAVGAPGTASKPGTPGAAYVYFGGAAISSTPGVSLAGNADADRFGAALVGLNDVDGDGRDDLAVLAWGALWPNTVTRAHVDVFPGATTGMPALMSTRDAGPAANGRRGLAARDLDGDSIPDLLVGRLADGAAWPSLVDVALGADGFTTTAVTLSDGESGDQFGTVIGR
jgi:hypothetical protein